MKYKINDTVEFKAESLSFGKILNYEKDTNIYSIELNSGSQIKCTEHYIKGYYVADTQSDE